MASEEKLRVLIVEDSENDAILLLRDLTKAGFEPEHRRVESASEMTAALSEAKWDIVLSDYQMPQFTGLDALGIVHEKDEDLPVIIVSGTIGEDVAVAAMKLGAHDYLMKGNLKRLGPAIRRELQDAEARRARRLGVERIRHLNRVLDAIRNVNRLIVREKDPARLIQQACEQLIETRGYHGAWIALCAQGSLPSAPAQAGWGAGFEPFARMLDGGRWPDCRADAATADGVAVLDPEVACRECPLRGMYDGNLAAVSCLRHQGRDFGMLGVSFPRGMPVDEEEESLLIEAVGDIAYALHGIETDRERRKSEETLRAIFESASDGILLADAESGRFMVGNDAICRMLGYSHEEIKGLSVAGIHPAEHLDYVRTQFERQARGEISLAADIPMKRKDGTVFPADVNSAPVELDGRRCLLGIVRDITGYKRAEEEREKLEGQLRASQKMEAIGSLAGGIAHDFNNLLSVILSYTGFALDAVPEGETLREDLLEVKNAGERSATLVRQLLAFGRKQLLEPKPLDLNQVMVEIEKMLRRILGEDIDFVQNLAPDLGRTYADPGQIGQVLMNLVVNARDAMPKGGKLMIETANVMLDEEYTARKEAMEPGPYVMLAVTDTGSGMDAQTRARIFEPFFTTKDKGKGTGLGLSTVYGIVRQSGGDVHVYSEPGQGTTFKIYLPVRSVTSQVESRIPATPTRLTGEETILVVEDEEAVCNLAKRILGAAGYTVLIATNGADALAECERHAEKIHLVLTDVVMPEMGGRVFAERLAKLRPGIKVLYMSGYTDNAIVHHGTLDPGTKFIGKPFNTTDLTRKVRETLDET